MHAAAKFALYVVIGCWWAFLLTFWLRKRSPRTREAKRDQTSLIGMALQSAAYACLWFHPLLTKSLSWISVTSPFTEWLFAVVTAAIAVSSVALVNSAARRLGKQWALTAKVVEGHDLIQDGPYRFVRNPIYTGMFGMLIATGFVLAEWLQLLVGIVLFLIGTWIRVRSEERLLREAFGVQFQEYVRHVPALIPGIY